jgi:hypothetical protein
MQNKFGSWFYFRRNSLGSPQPETVLEFAADTGPMPLKFSVAQQANCVKRNSAKRTLSKFHFHGVILARTPRIQQCDFSRYALHLRARPSVQAGD